MRGKRAAVLSTESLMKRKKTRPFWEMTTAELRAATKEFDEEFVGDKARPLSPAMRATLERAVKV